MQLHGVRQDSPPRLSEIDYEISVDADEDDRRIELLHTNVREYGTIVSTVSATARLSRRMIRKV